MQEDEEVEVAVHLHGESDRAWLVSDDGEKSNAEWVPKSRCTLTAYQVGQKGTLTIPEWLAKTKGFL